MHSKKQGFSLIELLLVIALIAVTASFSIPTYKNFIAYTQQLTLRAQLIHAINYARSEAMLREVPVSICGTQDHQHCSTNWQHSLLVFADENGNGKPIDEDHIIYVFDHVLKNGILFWKSSRNFTYLPIDPSGATHGINGKFWYCSSGTNQAEWAVVISLTGRAREVVDTKELAKLVCAV